VIRLRGDPCGPPFRREPQQYSTEASLAVKLGVSGFRLQAPGFRLQAPGFRLQVLKIRMRESEVSAPAST